MPDQLPKSKNPDDCNCLQCRELRAIEGALEYFSNPSNLLSLTVDEFRMKFWSVRLIRKDSVASYLLNQKIVLCRDGFIRPR